MRISKGKIQEIIDSDGNIIGDKDTPEVSPDNETQASKTTDYNAKVHGQEDLGKTLWGKLGFSFYESEGDNLNIEKTLAKIMYEKYNETLDYYHKNPKKLEVDWKKHQEWNFDSQPEDSREHDYEWAKDILKVLAPHIKEDLNEEKVIEDKLTNKKKNDLISKDNKDNDIIDKKMKKVANLLDKLTDNEIDKLIKVLENKKR